MDEEVTLKLSTVEYEAFKEAMSLYLWAAPALLANEKASADQKKEIFKTAKHLSIMYKRIHN